MAHETKESVLSIGSKVEKVVVGGEEFYMRPMPGRARAEIEWNADSAEKGPDWYLRLKVFLVGFSLCDEQGAYLFGSADEVMALADHPMLSDLTQAAQRINRMTAESVKELEGN